MIVYDTAGAWDRGPEVWERPQRGRSSKRKNRKYGILIRLHLANAYTRGRSAGPEKGEKCSVSADGRLGEHVPPCFRVHFPDRTFACGFHSEGGRPDRRGSGGRA